MDNPAVHNLDDVRLRAENGQIVLEVAGQTVPVDVDIDGSLSLDEIEAFTDNSIDAKGSDLENLGSVNTEDVDAESVNTEEANVGDGHRTVTTESQFNDALSDKVAFIRLTNLIVDTNNTISHRAEFRGTGGWGNTRVRSDTTFNARADVSYITFDTENQTTFAASRSSLVNCLFSGNHDVVIQGDGFRLSGNRAVNATFESETSNGVAIGNRGGSSIIDNGNNMVVNNI